MSGAKNKLESILANLNTEVTTEYRFHPSRRFRIDYYLPAHKVGIEFEGGAWTRGRHTRPKGFINDCTKYNLATAQGIKILRFTSDHLKDSKAVESIIRKVIDCID